jgi:hypothetical protein
VISRITSIFGEGLPDSVAQLIVAQLLATEDFLSAMASDHISDQPAREAALNTVQDWLLEQDDPTPLMEIAAAEIQRRLSGDHGRTESAARQPAGTDDPAYNSCSPAGSCRSPPGR